MARLEHIGIAVADAGAAEDLYQTLLGRVPYKAETVEREGVRTHFVSAESAKLELLEALGPESPVAKYLEKRGPGLHHLAFNVDDVDAHFRRLQEAGFRLLGEAPKDGADGKRIFFIHPKETHGVLIEFCGDAPRTLEPTPVPFQGGQIAAYERGRRGGRTVVLLHGAGGSTALEFDGLLRALEPHLHLVALDLPGHGASDAYADQELSIPFFADAVRAVLDAMELGQAHVFGYSLGGYVALYLARHHGARLDGLALHETGVFWDEATAQNLAAYFAQGADAEAPSRGVQAMRDAVGADRWPGLARRLASFISGMHAPPLSEDDLRQIPHAALVTAGDAGDVFPLAQTLRVRDTLPQAHVALLPNTGHRMDQVDLAAYAPILTRWFGG